MKEINYAKQKAIKRVLNQIAKTGYPTTQQLLFLQMFYKLDKEDK